MSYNVKLKRKWQNVRTCGKYSHHLPHLVCQTEQHCHLLSCMTPAWMRLKMESDCSGGMKLLFTQQDLLTVGGFLLLWQQDATHGLTSFSVCQRPLTLNEMKIAPMGMKCGFDSTLQFVNEPQRQTAHKENTFTNCSLNNKVNECVKLRTM